MKDRGYSKDIQDLIISRIDSQLPSDLKLFVGNGDSFTKKELIEHVILGDKVGRSIVESQMSFLKAVAQGTFIKAINSV